MCLKDKKSQSGFSLVELMVVVAIIGVLASIAVPAVTKYIAKARQSEAKTNLASLYTSEKAFFAEYTSYDVRFATVGYSPEGQLRYNVGFTSTYKAGTGNGYNGSTADTAKTTKTYCGSSGTMSNGCSILFGATGAAPADLSSGTLTQNTFNAEARAVVHQAGSDDVWHISHEKNVVNDTNGIP